MSRGTSALFVIFLCISSALASTYVWNGGNGLWNGNTPPSAWLPSGTPGVADTVIIPAGSNVTVTNDGNLPPVGYPYAVVGQISVQQLIVSTNAYLIITDLVSLYVVSETYVDFGGYLVIDGYLGSIDGTDDILVAGTLLLIKGNIQGQSSNLIILPNGNFNIQVAPGFAPIEGYLFRNTYIYGNATAEASSVLHVGFWWQPANVSIFVQSGGSFILGGYFSKYFEGFPNQVAVPPFPTQWSVINVAQGGYFRIYFSYTYVGIIVNFGVIDVFSYDGLLSYSLPFHPTIYNFGTINYNPAYQYIPGQAHDCAELQKWIDAGSKGDIILHADVFAVNGIFECVPTLAVTDAKIKFIGSGGLIFASSLVLENSRLEIEPGVDVVFTQQFHAKDSSIFIPTTSKVTMMFMPKDADGYHNYLDKSVKVHPEDQKKISFSGVKLIGGGSVDMLSELHLGGSGLVLDNAEVYFMREYNTSALTGSGDLIINKNGFASFGIESQLTGSGKISVFGKAHIPSISSVVSEKPIHVYIGGSLEIEGNLEMVNGAKVAHLN